MFWVLMVKAATLLLSVFFMGLIVIMSQKCGQLFSPFTNVVTCDTELMRPKHNILFNFLPYAQNI